MGDLSRYFDSSEFFSKDTYQLIKSCGHNPVWHINKQLISRLNVIREYFNSPVIISSGFRTQSENIIAGSKQKFSFHIMGMAADIIVKGESPKDVFSFIVDHWDSGGAGKYDKFTHIDVRQSESLIKWKA